MDERMDNANQPTNMLSSPSDAQKMTVSPTKQVKPGQNGVVKKRGRPPKVKPESNCEGVPKKQTKVTDTMKKAKRTVDRFKGVTKEELMQRLLPDRIKHGLDILIIGINPGLFAAYKGHHYAGPGNHFWSCINMSGMVDKPTSSENDTELLDYGIGFSTIVQRTTPSAKDLSSKEIREGGKELIEKIQNYRPKIAVFNGKGIYEVFSKEMFGQKKKDFVFGRQANKIPGTETFIYVMPSSSARCAQFPRAQDKVHYFIQIKRLRDEINGIIPPNDVVETDYTFDLQKATEMARVEKVKVEQHDPSYDANQVFPTPVSSFPTSVSPAVVTSSQDQPGCSSSQSKPTESKGRPKVKPQVSAAASGHPHLVRFLCQNKDQQETSPPANNSLRVPQLQDVVSDEQKNERVDKWVKTQIDQQYEGEPPMGYEERRVEGGGEPSESDHASQQSMVSAGVSGSTSTGSTSGYGSVDNNTHYARQDRVEMWVREQQYVRMQSAGNPPDLRPALPSRAPEHEQFMPDLPVSTPSYEAWNNFASQQLAFAGANSAANSMEGAFRPPVPLYSSWGGNEVGNFSGLAPNLNNNNSSIAGISPPQLNRIHQTFIP